MEGSSKILLQLDKLKHHAVTCISMTKKERDHLLYMEDEPVYGTGIYPFQKKNNSNKKESF